MNGLKPTTHTANNRHEVGSLVPVGGVYTWARGCLVVALLLVIGCTRSAEETFKSYIQPLRAAESIEFLTIDPRVAATSETENTVRGHEILGRTTLDRERFGVILDGLQAMVASGDSRNAKACFTPGYALREPAPGDAVVLICLECSRVQFTRGGKLSGATLGYAGAPELESYLSGLVEEFGLPTYQRP